MTEPVLILGTGVTALGVQRSLAQRRIPFYTLGHADHLLGRSRFTRPPPSSWGLPTEDGLDAWLSTLDLERAVLFPCSDSSCTEVSALPAELAKRFVSSVPGVETLVKLVDKAAFRRTMAELDVPHPMTVRGDEMGSLERLPRERLEHFFLKPRDSQRFFSRYGVKGVRVPSLEAASDELTRLNIPAEEMLMQEYIPGPPSHHYFIDGFLDRSGTYRSVFARQRLRMAPPDFGNSTLMETVPVSEVDGAVASLTRLLSHLDYRGIFSGEFKRDTRDGEFKLLEVNARAWWFVEFATTSGVEVCYQAYLDALERDVPTMNDYPVGRRCVHPYYDYHAYRAEKPGPFTFARWAASIVGASQPVFSWRDPRPGFSEGIGMVRRRCSSMLRRSSRG